MCFIVKTSALSQNFGSYQTPCLTTFQFLWDFQIFIPSSEGRLGENDDFVGASDDAAENSIDYQVVESCKHWVVCS